jgi:hypothetical protein
MERSEQINELVEALASAQGKIGHATKDSANPFFKSKYADLASVWEAIRGPLAEHGLSIIQCPSADGARVTITTMLAHRSGQWICSALTVTAKEDAPQAVGSAITYARRYALQSVAGVAPDDDDGEAAQGRRANDDGQWAKRRPTPPPPPAAPIPITPPQDSRPIPDELLDTFEALNQHQDAKACGQAALHMEKLMVGRAGEKGLDAYNAVTKAYRRVTPKGKDTVPGVKKMLLDLWEVYQKLPTPEPEA